MDLKAWNSGKNGPLTEKYEKVSARPATSYMETAAKGEKVRKCQLQFPVRSMQEIYKDLKLKFRKYLIQQVEF